MPEETKTVSPKRIVFSRKGFDGGAGGVPSPIFPDGSMLSLPIPAVRSMGSPPASGTECAQSHSDLEWNGRHVSDIVNLLRGRRPPIKGVHLDPDLDRNLKIKGKGRQHGWRGLFGQCDAAQHALRCLQPGDLFLFFGLFCRVIEDSRRMRCASREKLNVLFGWLQIEKMEKIGSAADADRVRRDYPWAACHPHLQDSFKGKNNTLYIARDKLEIEGVKTGIPGYGVFPYFSEALQLNEKDNSGGFWIMPTWFKPKGDSRAVWSSHPNGTTCWTPIYDKADNTVICHRIHLGPGQEFVLKCDEYPESIEWALAKIRTGLSSQAATASS